MWSGGPGIVSVRYPKENVIVWFVWKRLFSCLLVKRGIIVWWDYFPYISYKLYGLALIVMNGRLEWNPGPASAWRFASMNACTHFTIITRSVSVPVVSPCFANICWICCCHRAFLFIVLLLSPAHLPTANCAAIAAHTQNTARQTCAKTIFRCSLFLSNSWCPRFG